MPSSANDVIASCCGLTKERVLLIVLVLNSMFVVSQLVGTIVSHSLSLLTDTALMATDTLGYALSLYAQKQSQASARQIRRRVAVFNVASLLVTSTVVIGQSVMRLREEEEEEEEIDVGVMFFFVGADLAVDGVFMALFCIGRRYLFVASDSAVAAADGSELGDLGGDPCLGGDPTVVVTAVATEVVTEVVTESGMVRDPERLSVEFPPAIPEPVASPSSPVVAADRGELRGKDLNVLSVFAHAAADTLRTLAELAAVVLILAGADAVSVDAGCALLMSATILIAGIRLLVAMCASPPAKSEVYISQEDADTKPAVQSAAVGAVNCEAGPAATSRAGSWR